MGLLQRCEALGPSREVFEVFLPLRKPDPGNSGSGFSRPPKLLPPVLETWATSCPTHPGPRGLLACTQSKRARLLGRKALPLGLFNKCCVDF